MDARKMDALALAAVLALALAGCALTPEAGPVVLPPVVVECPTPEPVVLPARPYLPLAALAAGASREEQMAALRASLSLCLDYADEVRAVVEPSEMALPGR